MKIVNWGIVGLGKMANSFADDFPEMQEIYGCASYLGGKSHAKEFAKNHGIKKFYDNYEQMLADENIDVIYVATVTSAHYTCIKKALLANKHVMAEKAITLNSSELRELMNIAQKKHLILMEAQTIFHMPLFSLISQIANEKQLGRLRTIQVTWGSYIQHKHDPRLLGLDTGGGALLDIGVYAFSFARLFMSETPELIGTKMVKYKTGVDDQSSFLLDNCNNEQVTIALNLAARMPRLGLVVFENGFFTVENFARATTATFTDADLHSKMISAGDMSKAITYEVEDMKRAIITKKNPTLEMTRDVMTVMSKARKEWKLRFEGEKQPISRKN
ncbi:Gfo/Idh/MocA family protein [Pediococcus cellicola]|uniref:Oxidoreductase n=1 Tax=Pediococcus cellicola TaxID=319652 RepID=A0A0R2ITF2_9LACO|nr:Gfo/Idh/MocA family oxidoreductase [Pediococcus cellicola]KRN65516.1 oxidoreductase [Pediococcus cellicola]GEL15556.1 oxidoreductase [Pediococcus cellicola]